MVKSQIERLKKDLRDLEDCQKELILKEREDCIRGILMKKQYLIDHIQQLEQAA